jgi:hypothetical protein
MRLSKTTVDRQARDLSRLLGIFAFTAALGTSALTVPASALNIGAMRSLADQAITHQSNTDVMEIRAAARGGRAAVGPRGGAVVSRGAAVAGPRGGTAARRTTVVGPRGNVAVRNTAAVGGWARPGRYTWPRGGAIAAGAAIGFVTAATAVAWAGAPPAPGMCWYYTDPSRTQGFWDYCQ